MIARRWLSAAAILLVGTGAASARAAGSLVDEKPSGHADRPRLTYHVNASQARLNRRITGPVRRWVQGVAAEPANSGVWDGIGSVPIDGTLELEIDPMSNTGWIRAEWTDANGAWTFRQNRFIHPDDHPSGVRIGSSVDGLETIINEGVVHNAYLHGDTGAGAPVLPTVFTYLAAWGPARVTRNGEPFDNPFEIPAPMWLGHLMVTEGARRPDGTVRTLSGEIFNPRHASEGAVEPGDLEVHLVFHDDRFPYTSNVPNFFSFHYHVLFEEVTIEIVHTEPRLRPDRPYPDIDGAAIGSTARRGR